MASPRPTRERKATGMRRAATADQPPRMSSTAQTSASRWTAARSVMAASVARPAQRKAVRSRAPHVGDVGRAGSAAWASGLPPAPGPPSAQGPPRCSGWRVMASHCARFGRATAGVGHAILQEPVKLHEYHAKTLLARAGLPVPPYAVATTPEEARSQAAAYLHGGRQRGRHQGPGPRRWPRQGRRRQAGAIGGRGRDGRRGHPGHGHQGQHRAPRHRHAGRGHRARAVPRGRPRSGRPAHPAHGLSRGRRGHRDAGRRAPRGHRARARPSAAGPAALPGPADGLRARARRPPP